jgi:hypothetical protein
VSPSENLVRVEVPHLTHAPPRPTLVTLFTSTTGGGQPRAAAGAGSARQHLHRPARLPRWRCGSAPHADKSRFEFLSGNTHTLPVVRHTYSLSEPQGALNMIPPIASYSASYSDAPVSDNTTTIPICPRHAHLDAHTGLALQRDATDAVSVASTSSRARLGNGNTCMHTLTHALTPTHLCSAARPAATALCSGPLCPQRSRACA